MLFTPKIYEFEYEKPDIQVYKLNHQFLFPRASTEQRQRKKRAQSDMLLQTSKQMDFKEEIKKLEVIQKPQELKKEIFRQIKQTCFEFRNVERERDGSLWVKSYCTNEKVKLSNLFPGTKVQQAVEYRNFHSRNNSRSNIKPKKKLIELPQQAQLTQSKSKPSLIKLRVKSRKIDTEKSHLQLCQTERTHKEETLEKVIENKKVQQKMDFGVFDEMLNFYNQDRIVTISQDVMHRKRDFSKIRQELKKTLHYISRLNLDIYQAFSDHVISQRPFQKENSYEFIQAAKQGKEWEVKEFLKDNKFLVYDFDYIYMTALHWACKRGHFEIVKLLIENGADIEFQDIIGRPTLYFAIIGGNYQIVKYILDRKANPWSNSAVNYNQLCAEYNPSFLSLITQARKAHITLKMTPPSQRETIWKRLRK